MAISTRTPCNKKWLLASSVLVVCLFLWHSQIRSRANLNSTSGAERGDAEATSVAGNNVTTTEGTIVAVCPEQPPIQETKVPLNLMEVTSHQLTQEFSDVLQPGGHYAPITCVPRERIALIIPYRDRERNLHILLHNLIPFLVKQQAEFTIFLVEQTKDYLFNRCSLFNVGFGESKGGNFTCFILHDTDLIPRDYRNVYRCDQRPRHLVLSRSNEHWEEKLPYASFIGGAIALTRQHLEACNGCSNWYYGWGFEDDDLQVRLQTHGYPVVRYPMEIGGYYSLTHSDQAHYDSARGQLKQTMHSRMNQEGLNSLNYSLVSRRLSPLYTHLLVQLPPPPSDYYKTRK